MSEGAWIFVGGMTLLIALLLPVMVTINHNNDCRRDAIEKNMPVDDIIKLCGTIQ
jgi:hypothetical protein